jgi:pyruvate dehydrogenase E2 component (dihydrolipoamide acetyltransferase)
LPYLGFPDEELLLSEPVGFDDNRNPTMTKITMPQAGQSMEEGTILRWYKEEGEIVHKGETLFEIETDKANVEVEATESGVLRKILCPAGTLVPVLTPVAILAGATEDIAGEIAEAEAKLRGMPGGNSSFTPSQELSADSRESPEGRRKSGTEGPPPLTRASPAARRSAREQGVELAALWPGSGPGGRILSEDVARAAKAAGDRPDDVRRLPMTAMRKAIARNLIASKQNIPHFYVRQTIDAAPLHGFVSSEKAKYPCTLNDALILACARVILEFPAFRTRIEGDDLVEYAGANIGIAVGMEEGLRVPVLLGAERKSLHQIAAETRVIVDAAKQGKVEAMGRGVFTISNLGMYGVEEFAAIINPPEAALLAVGAIREAVVVKDGALRAGRVMTLTLSADHRVVDGLLAARFLNRLKSILEAPESLGS